MASYKNIQASRRKKDSHFSYSTERMTPLTPLTSSEAAPLKQRPGAVLSVKPNQDPLERTGEADREAVAVAVAEGEESTQSSVSTDLQINTEALSKLQVTQNKYNYLLFIIVINQPSFTGNNRSSKGFPEIPRDDQHLEVEAE